MTAQRDPDQFIKAFLEDGLSELPDRAYDAVRSEIDHTRQRVVFGPWRVPYMNNFARYAIAGAAVLVVTFAGVTFLPRLGGIGGPGPSPTPSPLPSISATKLPAETGALAPGTYYMDDATAIQARRLSFTVPAGWTALSPYDSGHPHVGGQTIVKNIDTPGRVFLATWVVDDIFGDVCQWRGSLVDAGTTIDQFVGVLAAQTGRTASAPNDVTIGGFPAKRIELTTPDQESAFCQGGGIHYWPDPGIDQDLTGLWGDGGDIDMVYAVEVAGKRLVLVARHSAESTAQDLAELNAIVASIRIEP